MTFEERLEEIYKDYPKKLGKSPGIRRGLQTIKTALDLDLLAQAIMNYKKHLKENKTESKYIMYFSTFMNQWRDWTDPNHGEIKDYAPKDQSLNARLVMSALKKVSPYSSKAAEELTDLLGDDLFKIVCKIGTRNIREMPPTDYTLKRLATMIQEHLEAK